MDEEANAPDRAHLPLLTTLLSSVYFLAVCCHSLPAAFYPLQAESKGLTKSEYGLVFGIYGLGSFLAAPFVGSHLHRSTPLAAYRAGVVLESAAVLLFGLLDHVQGHALFLSLSILRALAAVGASLVFVPAYTILTELASTSGSSPSASASLFAVMQLAFGVGFSVGPFLGEALFVAGGYETPFLCLGGVMLVTGIAISFYVPLTCTAETKAIDTEMEPRKGLTELLLLRVVALQVLCFTGATMSISFSFAILEPHLRQFKLSPLTVGLIFFIQGGVHASCSPLVAFLLPFVHNPAHLTMFGVTLNVVASLLIGPAPFFPTQSLALIIVGLFLVGISVAVVYTAAFFVALEAAREAGFSVTESSALVSSLWQSFTSLGSFAAPAAAGVLSDLFGFSRATLALTTLHSLTLLLLVAHEYSCKGQGRKDPHL